MSLRVKKITNFLLNNSSKLITDTKTVHLPIMLSGIFNYSLDRLLFENATKLLFRVPHKVRNIWLEICVSKLRADCSLPLSIEQIAGLGNPEPEHRMFVQVPMIGVSSRQIRSSSSLGLPVCQLV